jgi:colanic acid/amylovoran biosynthesis glycosyltransferase
MGSPGIEPVWVLCWRYPVLSETIVPTEAAELARQGMNAILVPLQLLEGTSETFGIPESRILRPAPWPPSTAKRLILLASAAKRSPAGAARLARRLVDYAGDDARGALVTSAQVLGRAHELPPPGHIHAHFAGHLAHVAALLAAFFDCTWSTTAHARDIYTKPERLEADFRDAAFVRTISSHGQEWVGRNAGLDEDKIPLIHCGVDDEALQPEPAAPIGHRPWRLISVGRLVPKKGHDLLARSVARLRAEGLPLECQVIGEGPEAGALEKLARELGIELVFRVRQGVKREPMLRLLREADAMVLASRVTEDGDREGIPLALMEAMALGKPVIAGDVGGTRELVEGAGALFDGRTEDSLTGALRGVLTLSDPDRAGMVARCRERVEAQFSLRKNVAQFRLRLLGAMADGARMA